MLSNSDTRVGAVRFLLAWSILSNVGYKSQVDHTLLPPALAECLCAMNLETQSSSALLSQWRHVTGALIPPSKTMSSDDPRQFNISQLARDVNDVLRSFASPDDIGRFANMTEILRQGAYVGYVTLVQPTTWAFEWEDEADGRHANELVVFPALVQISDEHGRPRNKALRSMDKQSVPRAR
ncbi:uncharacterized protein MYCFIDRAFT_212430 [Pseudocercospora fijiensis CIRAD86]|uniref:Uncharacterized protein n=1 Tax=Pseudocercospora fijiensis (strain CIRAD86) TaxID=383855 RepID=M2ZHJ0_PSEFD|nr:uncharacterized protein MYCFIDRAFT_212430 [Pseudocercospora fijiensis CIRAD86]EME78604.1 hypothetical protein MYCFIDRAFT_212430 [Pseudocercospora fijiensis CIRAD86]